MAKPFRFFEKSRADFDIEEVALTVTSGAGSIERIRDRTTYRKWQSIGSDDTTTETITIDWNSSQTIDSIFVIKSNWKEYTIKYWDGASYVDFSTVIAETTNTDETKLHEFDAVTTERIQINIETTFVADAEKQVFQVVPTKSVGTFVGYPQFAPNNRIERVRKELLNGKPRFSDYDFQFRCTMTFQRYPVAADHSIITSLFLARREFLFWPCGGDETQFRFEFVGTRLEDLFLVQFADGQLPQWFEQNIYENGAEYSISLEEVA